MENDEIISILSSERSSDKDKLELLSHLCDIFESYSEEYGGLGVLVQALVDFAANETDPTLKEEYINTIQSAASSRDVSKIEFEKLIDEFASFDHRMKLDVIDILGFSHNSKYLEFLRDQESSDNTAISSTATMALQEITTFFAKKK